MVLLCYSLPAQANDTIRVMTYNLLNYRLTSNYCDNGNNHWNTKDSNMAIIIDYVKPHLLLCQEMSGSDTNGHWKLLQVLRQTDTITWKKIAWQSNGSSMTGGIYYRSDKLAFCAKGMIEDGLDGDNLTRGIEWVHLAHRDTMHAHGADTVYLRAFNAHFKAGSYTSDEQQRDRAAKALMAFCYQNPGGAHRIIGGDFNVKRSQEPCYQTMTQPANVALRFNDPISMTGTWNNAYAHRHYHTQSTRTSADDNSGCFSTGGMDDRLDQILLSDGMVNGVSRIQYIPGSYHTVGNDGQHFDKHLKDGANNSVPPAVLDALYDMSDHLPVVLDLSIIRGWTGLSEDLPEAQIRTFDSHHDIILGEAWEGGQYQWINVTGQVLAEGVIDHGVLQLNRLEGVGVLRLEHPAHEPFTLKLN